ncbi:MAG: glycosyl transferase, family 2 [uncultured bacterium]|nr:MAG: glycosyl transferase, family 2 [uncultured bacterium]
MKSLSIIIPTANDLIRLSLTLSSICFQSIDLKLIEVIVINKPSDKTPHELISLFKNILDIRLFTQKNTSRSEARNIGLLESTGEIILFIDDDLILTPDFINHHLKHHNQALEVVVIGEVKNLYFSDLKIHFKSILDDPFDNDWYFSKLNWIENKSRPHPYFSLTRIPFINTAINKIPWIGFGTNNSSVKKEHLLKINCFEETYKGWGFDNIETGLRLYQNGLKYIYEPSAINYHLSHARNKEEHINEFQENFNLFKKRNQGNHIDYYWEFINGNLSVEEFNSRLSNQIPPDSCKQHFYKDYQNLLKWIELSK